MTAELPLEGHDGDRGHQPGSEHPEGVAGAAAAEAEQKCTHGGPPGSGPHGAGGDSKDPPRPLPGPWPPLTQLDKAARVARARSMSSVWKAGTGAPTCARRRSASASIAVAVALSPVSRATRP